MVQRGHVQSPQFRVVANNTLIKFQPVQTIHRNLNLLLGIIS